MVLNLLAHGTREVSHGACLWLDWLIGKLAVVLFGNPSLQAVNIAKVERHVALEYAAVRESQLLANEVLERLVELAFDLQTYGL